MKTWQDKEEFKRLFTEKAYRLWEKELQELTLNEVYQTIAYMIRDLVSEDWIRTNQSYAAKKVKQVYYFPSNFSWAACWNQISSMSIWTTSAGTV